MDTSLPTEPERTGQPAVDAVIDDVLAATARPVHEHPAAFTAAHARLTEALASSDRAQPERLSVDPAPASDGTRPAIPG